VLSSVVSERDCVELCAGKVKNEKGKIMLGKMFRKIAGVDERLLKQLPYDDTVWMTQIGIVLFVSYMFVYTVVYFSLDYIVQSGGFAGGWITAFIAFLLTTLTVLMDRVFIMGDWYNGSLRYDWKKGIASFIVRILKLLPRLAISVFIAYTLGEALLLRFYDTKIKEEISRYTYVQNAQYRQEFEAYKTNYELTIRRMEEKVKQLLHSATSQNMPVIAVADAKENSLREQIDTLQHEIDKLDASLNNLKTNQLLQEFRQTQHEIGCLDALIAYEGNATQAEEITICGNTYRASGIEGVGRNVRQLRAKRDALDRNLVSLKTRAMQIEKEIKRLGQKREQMQKELDTVRNELRQYIDKRQIQYADLGKKKRDALNKELEETQTTLEELKKNKESNFERFRKKLVKQGLYHRQSDGPMVRYAALQRLYADETYGEDRKRFSMMIKIVLVLFELMPLLMKVTFAKRTPYGDALRLRQEQALRKLEEKGVFDEHRNSTNSGKEEK